MSSKETSLKEIKPSCIDTLEGIHGPSPRTIFWSRFFDELLKITRNTTDITTVKRLLFERMSRIQNIPDKEVFMREYFELIDKTEDDTNSAPLSANKKSGA